MPAVLSSLSSEASGVLHDMVLSRNGDGGGGMLQQLVSRFTAAVGALVEMEQAQAATSALGITDAVVGGVTDAATMVAADQSLISSSSASVLAASTSPFLSSLARLFARFLSYFTGLLKASPWAQSISAMIHRLVDAADYDAFSAVNDTFGNRMLDRLVRLARLMYRATADALRFGNWILNPVLLLRRLYRISVGLIVLYCVHMFVNFAGDRIRRFFDWFYIERGIWRQDPKCIRKRELEEQMTHAKNYTQWHSAAQQMDELEYERMEWKETKQSTEYEWRRIERNVECLRKLIDNHQSQQYSPTPSIAPSPSTVGAVAPLHPGENSPPKKLTSILNPTVAGIAATTAASQQSNSPIAAAVTTSFIPSDPQALMRYLRSRLFRHIGNITNSRLYYDVNQHFTSHFPDPPPTTTATNSSSTAASSSTTTRSSSFSATNPPTLKPTSFPNLSCHVGTKKLIESYHQEVIRGLDTVLMDPSIPSHTKLAFFRETRHAYGRSALLLNGGANLGLMHLGVVKALLEIDCLPQIISGSSVGAIFAALICSRTDDDLRQIGDDGFLELKFPSVDGSLRRKLRRFLTEGILMDISTLILCVRTHIGDLTFLQAYERFGRILNIAVTPIHMGKKKRKNSDTTTNSTAADEEDESQHSSEPILLNYLTAPSVLIWSAACASCAVPHLYAPVELLAKSSDGSIVPYFQHSEGDETMRFGAGCVDGSVAKMDVHVDRLRTLFNCSNFIVSQLNLSLLPFIFEGTSFSNASPLQKLLRYLAREIYQRVTNFSSLFGVNASSLGRQHTIVRVLLYMHALTSQAFKGDITLVPPVSWRDYSQLLENPSTKRLNHCVDVARRYTWTRASLIKAHCVVEFALDRCVRKIRTEIGISTLPSASNAAFAHPNKQYSSIAYAMNNSSSHNMNSISPFPSMNLSQSPAHTPAQPVTSFWSKKLNARALHSSRKHSLTSDMPIPPQQIQGLPPAGDLSVGRLSPSFHPVSALSAMQNGVTPMHRPIATTPGQGQGSGSVTPVGYPTSSPGAFIHSSNAPRHRSNSSVSNTSGSPVMLPVMIPQLMQQNSNQLPLSPLQLGPSRTITNGHATIGPSSAQPSPRNNGLLSQSVPTPANIIPATIPSLTQSQPHPQNRVLEYLSNAEVRVGEGSMTQLPVRPLPANINPSAAVVANSHSNFDLNGLRIVPGASPQSPDYAGTVAAAVVNGVGLDEDEVASGPFGEGDADDDRDSEDENHSEFSSPIPADSSRDDLTVEMEQDASSSSNLPSAASSRTASRTQRRRPSHNGRSLSQLSQRSRTSHPKAMNVAIPSPTITALKEELQLRLSREGSKQSVNGVTPGSNGADGSLLRAVPSLPGANGSAASLLLQLPASTSGSKLDDGFNTNVMAHLNQQMLFVMPKSNTKKNPREAANVKKMNPTPAPSPAVDGNTEAVLSTLVASDGEKKEGLTVSLSPTSGNASAKTPSSTETSPIILHCASTSSSEGSSVEFDVKPIDKPLSTC